jgi:hypothetical protein
MQMQEGKEGLHRHQEQAPPKTIHSFLFFSPFGIKYRKERPSPIEPNQSSCGGGGGGKYG